MVRNINKLYYRIKSKIQTLKMKKYFTYFLLGSRSSTLNFEARSVDTRLPARKCVIVMINEFNPSRFRELINEGVGALLIIIPSDLETLSNEMREVG